MDNIFERTIGLLGHEKFEEIQEKKIAIFGLGGVGGTALEALARTGFKNFYLVDFDIVSNSNLNRQVLYKLSDVGKKKVECAKKHILEINPDADIETFFGKAQEFDFNKKIDYVVDAIDDVEGKLFIAKSCDVRHVPLVMSLGMANRYDPSKVIVTTLNKTFNDPLARKIRYEFKQNKLSLSSVNVVFSLENPMSFEGNLNSIMSVPSSAGLNIASHIINCFLKEEKL